MQCQCCEETLDGENVQSGYECNQFTKPNGNVGHANDFILPYQRIEDTLDDFEEV